MDILVDAVKPILTDIIKAAITTGVKAAAGVLHDHLHLQCGRSADAWSEQQLDAVIDHVLGNGFTQQFLDIKNYLDGTLTSLRHDVAGDILGQAAIAEFRAFERDIEKNLFAFTPWLTDPMNPAKQRHFLAAYDQHPPARAIYLLHKVSQFC